VHPVLPYLLTSSDDMLIKLWDWDKGWACCQVFEGHSHYVMQVGRVVVAPAGQSSVPSDVIPQRATQAVASVAAGTACLHTLV